MGALMVSRPSEEREDVTVSGLTSPRRRITHVKHTSYC